MANKDDNGEKDFVNFVQHKNVSSGLSFIHQQNIMDLTPVKSGKRLFLYSQNVFISQHFSIIMFVPV